MLFITALLLVALLAAVVVRDYTRKRTVRLPPGPPGLPLVGNMFDLPTNSLYAKLHEWSKQYGPFYGFWIMNQPFVVLGNVEVSADILDRMSAITSDRPAMLKARKFYFRDMIVMLQDRTLMWRAQRQAIHANLNVRAVQQFQGMQTNDAACLALGILHHPEVPFHRHAHRYSASTIVRFLYGGDAIPLLGPDPSKRVEELTNAAQSAVMPQNTVVDALPFLLPLIEKVGWLRKRADTWFDAADQEATRLFESGSGTGGAYDPTFFHHLQSNGEKYGLPKSQAIWLAMALFMAGQETTPSALRIFALAMLHYPTARYAAQRQLDDVCKDRPPSFEDMDNLPYIQAVVKETLRWRAGVPLSLPHRASEEFEYQGYRIPKGTILIDNLWSQTRDPAVYADAECFEPKRFLDDWGSLRPVTPDTRLDQLGFGHGRRICPGRDFAFNSMLIACAYLLWAFDFEWPVDEHGKLLTCGADDLVDTGTVLTASPFGVNFKPRKDRLSEKLMSIVNKENQ